MRCILQQAIFHRDLGCLVDFYAYIFEHLIVDQAPFCRIGKLVQCAIWMAADVETAVERCDGFVTV